MRVKVFNFEYAPDVETAINQWLAETFNISITEILQSESYDDAGGWSLTISIFYIGGE